MLWARNLYLNLKSKKLGVQLLTVYLPSIVFQQQKFKIQSLCAFSVEKVHLTVRLYDFYNYNLNIICST